MKRLINARGLTAAVAALAMTGGTLAAGAVASSASTPAPRAASAVAGDERVAHLERGHAVPSIAKRWTDAWTTPDTQDLARLYTRDAVYTDHTLGLVFHGRKGVAQWEAGSRQLIPDVEYVLQSAFRGGDSVVVQGLFRGRIAGAPKPFSIPIATVLHLRGNLVQSSYDYYNRQDVLVQSGLPLDWKPPTG
ncbi:hypothetical protein Asp14428_75920 [Actinoplanes sp. NBRC 14428]|uniref:Ketosteroid isomerase-like protein n=1 Tax=Pseudosporangium ferrugineum TaxID=439699 RepID=A0A2T0RXB2_9ACTN|nr:nuclear transport factor 2 family protein [Pseudosporangium ferrugineum]PRY25829.1 ketosteroid isomerase-like protein [Pseudosporangium ferrugineum]BCJ56117.1 hypothetical protein Asp14428_75920 [Actinoplanes sp. NBRC 14428]